MSGDSDISQNNSKRYKLENSTLAFLKEGKRRVPLSLSFILEYEKIDVLFSFVLYYLLRLFRWKKQGGK